MEVALGSRTWAAELGGGPGTRVAVPIHRPAPGPQAMVVAVPELSLYRLHGLWVASELPLFAEVRARWQPGSAAGSAACGGNANANGQPVPDLILRWGTGPSSEPTEPLAPYRPSADGPALAAPEAVGEPGSMAVMAAGPGITSDDGGFWRVRDNDCLVGYRDQWRLRVRDGREAWAWAARPLDPERDGVGLTALMMSIAVHQRGLLPLHGSGVVVGDRVHIFCGDSGAGKSTLAAALQQRGYTLFADDVCVLSCEGGDLLADADGQRLKLRPGALPGLALAPGELLPIEGRNGRFAWRPDAARSPSRHHRLAVAGIYALRAGDPGSNPQVAPLRGTAALQLLLRYTHRNGLVQAFGQQRSHFDRCLAAARCGVFWDFQRPWNLADLPRVIDFLEALWDVAGS